MHSTSGYSSKCQKETGSATLGAVELFFSRFPRKLISRGVSFSELLQFVFKTPKFLFKTPPASLGMMGGRMARRKDGRQEGWTPGRMEGGMEGGKQGRTDERNVGRKEGLKDGRQDGWKDGRWG